MGVFPPPITVPPKRNPRSPVPPRTGLLFCPVQSSIFLNPRSSRRFDGGIIVDVQSGEIVIGGLSMPHSPRVYNGKLYVLNSGTGELGWIERADKAQDAKFHVVAFCPGFVRGLGFHGKFAFVGLSKPRYERFEGLALDKRLTETDSEPWCGVQVIDLDTGACVHWFRIDGPVGELYDVAVVPGVMRPMSLSFASNEVMGLITHDPLDEGGFSA